MAAQFKPFRTSDVVDQGRNERQKSLLLVELVRALCDNSARLIKTARQLLDQPNTRHEDCATQGLKKSRRQRSTQI
jgi:hypothetical protein